MSAFVVNGLLIKADHSRYVVRACNRSHQFQRIVTAVEAAVIIQRFGGIDPFRHAVDSAHARPFHLSKAGVGYTDMAGKYTRHVKNTFGELVLKLKPIE